MASEEEQRLAQRLELGLPILAKVGESDHIDLELVDISASGMRFVALISMC